MFHLLINYLFWVYSSRDTTWQSSLEKLCSGRPEFQINSISNSIEFYKKQQSWWDDGLWLLIDHRVTLNICLNWFSAIKLRKLSMCGSASCPICTETDHLRWIMLLLYYIIFKQKAKCHYIKEQITLWGWPDCDTWGMDHQHTSSSFSKKRWSFYPKACSVFCYRIHAPAGAFVGQDSSSTVSFCIQPVYTREQKVRVVTEHLMCPRQ